MRGLLIFVFLFFTLMASFAFFGGLKIITQVGALQKNGIETTAVVVGFEVDEPTYSDRTDKNNRQYRSYYFPILTYSVNNKTIQATAKSGSADTEYSIDDAVDIIYDAENVENFVIKDKKKSTLTTGVVSTFIGLVLLIILAKMYTKRKVIFEKINAKSE